MLPKPKRPNKTPGRVTAYQKPLSESKDNSWILYAVLSIIIAAGLGVVAWRIQIQREIEAKDKAVVALLETADQLILKNFQDDAEAAVREALGKLPGDVRCMAVLERIETKRKMLDDKASAAAKMTMERAEQLALSNIAGAIEILTAMRTDAAVTAEAKSAADERIKQLRGGVCSLRLPVDWPIEGVVTVDDITKTPKTGIVSDIVSGKRTVQISRYGYSQPPPVEFDFRGTQPLQYPNVEWRQVGAKVLISSIPAGAEVWHDGKNTGKITPCTIEDVSNGIVEYVLKHNKYPDTSVRGIVKNREPLKLSVTFKP